MSFKSFVLSFDLPRDFSVLRTRIHRRLKKIGAKKIQDSFWRAENLQALVEIAILIKTSGGSATILEEKFIF